jgi:hypothetical protein
MFTRSAVFATLGPPCPAGQHEWRRLGTWTVYCRRCYHHHATACCCPARGPCRGRAQLGRRGRAMRSYA